MRIAYLSSSVIPSATANSVHVMKMCRAFERAGHRVTLYAQRRTPADEDFFSWYGVEPSFEVVRWERRPIHRWDREGAYTRAVRREVARRPLPDLIYARRARSLVAVAGLRVPLVFEAHEPPLTWWSRQRERWLFARPNFCRLVVISHALGREYVRMYPGLDPLKVLVAPDGADVEERTLTESPPSREPGEAEPFRVGYAGQLFPGRGMEVITALAARMPEVEFHVIGGNEAQLARWSAGFALPNVIYHGFIPPAEVSERLQFLDLVLAPYQHEVQVSGRRRSTARWMSPLKLFEYMAASKPIISSDLPVLREVLENEWNALLVEPTDLDGWERSVRRLREDRELRQMLAARAHASLEAKYTWRRRADRVLEGLR